MLLAEEHQRLMMCLPDDTARQVARLRTEGYSAAEVAAELGLSLRTVERRLRAIREAWAEANLGLSSSASSSAAGRSVAELPLDLLEPHMHRAGFAAGDFIMRQGEPGDSLMVIREGTAEISIEDEQQTRHVIAQVTAGQVVGEMALLTNQPRSANVVATDSVSALVLPAETFHQLAAEHPRLSVVLTNLVAERLGRTGRDALSDKVLDRYRIRSRLGRGGMGTVYHAERLDDGRQVALKMMNHRLVYHRRARERFEQEADLIEALDHPNIVSIDDRFTAFHTCFICLEFCEGGSLADAIAVEGPLPADQIGEVFSSVAAALEYAHRQGIVHRDVKPANILLTGDEVKLTDFGLAQPLDVDQAGGLFGTPRYMAPEQLAARPASKQADYFALACVAYEMITGHPLFTASDIGQLRRLHEQWQPPAIRHLRDDLDEGLCQSVQDCLHKEPDRRRLIFQ